jgi:hypothetical protein
MSDPTLADTVALGHTIKTEALALHTSLGKDLAADVCQVIHDAQILSNSEHEGGLALRTAHRDIALVMADILGSSNDGHVVKVGDAENTHSATIIADVQTFAVDLVGLGVWAFEA